MTAAATFQPVDPASRWGALIDDMVAGRWIDPATGAPGRVPYDRIVIADRLDGHEAELVAGLGLGGAFTVVADARTQAAMGARVAEALGAVGPTGTLTIDEPHADMATVERLAAELPTDRLAVAVGSGTINDLVKMATLRQGRRYCVFATAASMNGYTSTTASITLPSGLKVSLPAQAPAGFFADLAVSAAAPRHLSAAGFADCLVRSVAQVDWWMSHRLIGSTYAAVPFLIQEADEVALNARAAGIAAGDLEANGYLHRVLTLCGLGVSFTGMSNHGSMGEHQISHYIDCFAGPRHPGTLHGQQVGVGVLTMGRLQQAMLSRAAPPVLRPSRIDPDDMARRMGPEVAAQCLADIAPKLHDGLATEALNDRLAAIWPDLRRECAAFLLPVAEMERLLRAAGGPCTAAELGLDPAFYREAVVHCREMRNRLSFLDLAADAGELDSFAEGEA